MTKVAKCPACKSGDFYQGLNEKECSNAECRYFSNRWKKILEPGGPPALDVIESAVGTPKDGLYRGRFSQIGAEVAGEPLVQSPPIEVVPSVPADAQVGTCACKAMMVMVDGAWRCLSSVCPFKVDRESEVDRLRRELSEVRDQLRTALTNNGKGSAKPKTCRLSEPGKIGVYFSAKTIESVWLMCYSSGDTEMVWDSYSLLVDPEALRPQVKVQELRQASSGQCMSRQIPAILLKEPLGFEQPVLDRGRGDRTEMSLSFTHGEEKAEGTVTFVIWGVARTQPQTRYDRYDP